MSGVWKDGEYMSYYGDGSGKQVIRDAISWAKDDYEDSEEGRKQFVTDLMQVCADYVSDILEGWG